MTYRVKNIGIAVLLAAFAGLLTVFYVANYKRHVQHGEKNVSVLVAARDIPAGTTGSEVVEQHYLASQSVPRRSVVPGAISKPDQLNNLVVTQQVFRGEQVTTRSFGTAKELGIRAQLRANERAYELNGDQNALLAGTLKDGDHVDVVASWQLGSQNQVGRVILRNLRVPDTQSQRLFWAAQNGKLALVLRPPADSRDSAPSVDNSLTLLRSR